MTRLPYVNEQKGRDGRIYYYFRRRGSRCRLPGDEPTSPEFLAEYQLLLASTAPAVLNANAGEPPPGSFAVLVKDYLASPEFREKKPSTQKMYRRVLEPLVF